MGNKEEEARQTTEWCCKQKESATSSKEASNETQPTPKDNNKNPQLTTKDWDSNSGVAIIVGEVSKQEGDLSMLT